MTTPPTALEVQQYLAENGDLLEAAHENRLHWLAALLAVAAGCPWTAVGGLAVYLVTVHAVLGLPA